MAKNILITGGCGFIGSHVVRHFIKKYPEYKIVNLDKLTYAADVRNVADVTHCPNYNVVYEDITSPLNWVFEYYDIDTVIHLAAESHVDNSINAPLTFERTNVMGTNQLLEAARNYWSGKPERFTGKMFYHISTDEVYGALKMDYPSGMSSPLKGVKGAGCRDVVYGHEFFTETTPYSPRSPYSASKAASDHIVMAYHHTYGMPVLISHCSNNYGPCQHHEKLIPLFIRNIIRREPLPVYGDGSNVRDWLYVTDHVKAIDTILHNGTNGEVYNIGGFNEWKNIDLVMKLIEITDKALGRPPMNDVDLITYVKDRPGHDKRYAIDSSKLQNELGWEPETPFADGIMDTVQWYLDKWSENEQV